MGGWHQIPYARRAGREELDAGMMAVYYENPRQLLVLLAPEFSGRPLSLHRDWSTFEEACTSAVASVAMVRQLAADGVPEQLTPGRESAACTSLVLMTDADRENAALAKAAPVRVVLWSDDEPGALLAALERVRVDRDRNATAVELREAGGLPPQLRTVLVRLFLTGSDGISIDSLAAGAGCDRSTLNRQWRSIAGASSLRLQDVLDWLLLIDAVRLQSRRRKWAGVAAELGVHPRTLTRIAERLAGMSLPQAAAAGELALTTLLRGNLAPLLAAQSA